MVKLKYPVTGSSTLINHSFVTSDYSPATGLQGSTTAPKYLDTGVLPSALFTPGTYGFGFWVGPNCADTSTNLIGTAGNTVPTVYMNRDPVLFAGGIGESAIRYRNPPSGAEGFNYGIRQSASLLELFLNGKVVASNTGTIGASTAQNVSFGIFAQKSQSSPFYTNPTGCKGFYYSIDDGTLTNSQATQYYNDVKQLLISLGRVETSSAPMKMALIEGQSLATADNGTPALSTIPQFTNKMFTEGTLLYYSSPWAEAALTGLEEFNTETVASSFANLVSSTTRSVTPGDASQDLTIANLGLGGTGYVGLALGAGGSTGPFAISTTSVANLLNLSSSYTTGGVVVPGIIVVHGETDANNVNYQANIRQWQVDYDTEIKKITGQTQNVVMFHSQPSAWTSQSLATSKSPYEILAESELNPSKTILVGPKYFLPYGTGGNGIHLTNTGYRTLGEYYAKAWNKVIVQGQTWNPLKPVSEVLNGQNVDLTFTGNVGNLVLDTTAVSNPGNYGFEYYDDASSATISTVSLTGSNTVRVTLSNVPTGANKRIRYAFTGISGNNGGTTTGPRGNLRDSDPTLSMYDDNGDGQLNDHLYDWSVHFDKRIPVTIVSALATPSANSASIALNSGMTASSSRIFFGPTTTYGTSTAIITNQLTPTFTLSSLKPCTIYHYMASSTGPTTVNAPVYDPTGYGTTIADTGTSTDQNFTTTGCTGSASVTASSTNTITTGSGGSLSLGVLSLTVPTSYSGTTTSANFQAKQLNPTAFSASAGTPSSKILAGSTVINLEALIDATTILPTFSQPLTVTMSYSSGDISGISESSLKIYRYDGSSWNLLNNCSVDTGAKTVTCQTSNFSDFGMYGDSLTISTVNTSAASGVSTSTATLNGNISATGGADATQSGFAYGTTADLSTVIATTTLGAKTGTASFSQSLTGLTPNRTYYFRAYAVNSAGTSIGSILSFNTNDVTPPAVSFSVPSNGSTTSGSSISLSAIASDDVGVVGVQFILDGSTNIGAEVTSVSSPNTYTTTWDSTGITSYGVHTLYTVARDAAGNHATSTIAVIVNNTGSSHMSGTIDSSARYAWMEAGSWLDFGTTAGNVIVTDTSLTGYAWSSEFGWVSLNCFNDNTCSNVNYGVANDGNGNLSGYAWGETTGWINFNPQYGGVTIGSNGEFAGYAWSDQVGWISFNCSNDSSCSTVDYKVKTNWLPIGARPDVTPPTVSLTSPSGGSTVAGSSVSLSATAADNSAIAGVQFMLDGTTNIGSEITSTSSPNTYTTTWNSTGITSYGSHTLYAVARDAAGNHSTSTVVVNVDNVAPTLVSAAYNSDTQITIILSKLANASSITKSNNGGFIVTKTGSGTTYSVTSIAPGSDNSKVVLTVVSMSTSGSAGVTVTYAAGGNGTVMDTVGNLLASDGTGIIAVNNNSYSIGGTVSGLNGTVILQNNSGDNKSISANGSFAFAASIANGNTYNVTVLTQPAGQTCSVSNASGTVSVGNVTGISVVCSANSVASTPQTTPAVSSSISSGGGGSASNRVSNLLSMGFTSLAQQVAKQYGLTIPNAPGSAPSTPAIPSSGGQSFTRTLRLGVTNTDVKKLQIFLNAQGFTIAKKGAGSPGHETTYFGQATKAALMKFQLAHKTQTLDPQELKAPTGFFGVDTMKAVNMLIN